MVAYALAGSLKIDVTRDPLGDDANGDPVYLKDVWPSNDEIRDTIAQCLTPAMYRSRYADVFHGPEQWRRVTTTPSTVYDWQPGSTYVKLPPFFEGITPEPEPVTDVAGARVLARLGDSVTTDHISPAGAISKDSPAGSYLTDFQVRPREFNSYGSRRGNHEVMMRGTFANIRIRNEMVPGTEGGLARHMPSGDVMPIYDAAMRYAAEGVPLLVIAGKEYGTGSSRDWAAKGTRLLGIRAVIVESFERIHRSNLIGMGVLPLQFTGGATRDSLGLDGGETFDLAGIADGLAPRAEITLTVHRASGATEAVPLLCRIDTLDEVEYFNNGGILHYVLRNMMKQAA